MAYEAALAVHRELGPGFSEVVYRDCLVLELRERGAGVDQEVVYPIHYKGRPTGRSLRLDLVVEDALVLELKSVENLNMWLARRQLLAYLKLSGIPLGLVINFNVPLLKQGVKRVIL